MKKSIMILLCSTAICFGMDTVEQDVEQITVPLKIIKGTLVLHPHECLMYSPYVQKGIKKAFGIEIEAADPVVSVRIFKDDGSSKTPIFLPDPFDTCPEALPLRLLRDKKNGDTLSLMVNDTTTKLLLTCNQQLYFKGARFENQLTCLIKEFKKKPEFHLFDEEKLIEQGIIIKIVKGSTEGAGFTFEDATYKHGPNGYVFN